MSFPEINGIQWPCEVCQSKEACIELDTSIKFLASRSNVARIADNNSSAISISAQPLLLVVNNVLLTSKDMFTVAKRANTLMLMRTLVVATETDVFNAMVDAVPRLLRCVTCCFGVCGR